MKRPFGVTFVGILLLVQGILLLGLAAAVLFLRAAQDRGNLQVLLAFGVTRLTVTDVVAAVVVGTLGIFVALSGIGVLRLLSWAWLAAMALQGWTLALFLFDYFTHGESNYLSALFSVVIVFYLNTRTVRHTFDLVHRRESSTAALPRAIAPAGSPAGSPARSAETGAEAEVTSSGTRRS